MLSYKSPPDHIISLDETEVNIVLPSAKVLAVKEQR